MAVRDRDRLRNAFAELRALGYWARANQDDGWDSVPDDVLKRSGKVVFWHARETESAFDDHGDLMRSLRLQHAHRDAEEIVRVLTQHGLAVSTVESRDGPEVVVGPAPRHARKERPR